MAQLTQTVTECQQDAEGELAVYGLGKYNIIRYSEVKKFR